MKLKSILVILRPKISSEFSSILLNLKTWMEKRNISLKFLLQEKNLIEKLFKSSLAGISFVKENESYASADLIITLGGDGTFIGAARHLNRKSPPVLAINMGKLGFITEFSKAELFDALGDVFAGKYELENIDLFRVEVFKPKGKKYISYFLNDAVVSKSGISRMFRLSVGVDEERIYNLSGDGLIISSPIGSTAYSMAAGGPIINPKVDAMVLTPICPHGLWHRPLVVPGKSKVEVKTPVRGYELALTLDGQEEIVLFPGTRVLISKAKGRGGRVVKNLSRTYFHTLTVKLSHGKR